MSVLYVTEQNISQLKTNMILWIIFDKRNRIVAVLNRTYCTYRPPAAGKYPVIHGHSLEFIESSWKHDHFAYVTAKHSHSS